MSTFTEQLDALRDDLLNLHGWFDSRLDDENADRQYLLEDLLRRLLLLVDNSTAQTVTLLNARIAQLRAEQTDLVTTSCALLATGQALPSDAIPRRLCAIKTEARGIALYLRRLGALDAAADAADGWAIVVPRQPMGAIQ